MKKTIILFNVVLAGLACANPSYAHSLSGFLDDNPSHLFGNTGGTVDYYQVACFTDNGVEPAGLETYIRDMTPDGNTRVTVIAKKSGAPGQYSAYKPYLSSAATDLYDNDAQYSESGAVVGGDGVYDVLVMKDGENSQVYELQYHCLGWNLEHAGTSITQVQDQ